MVGLIAFIVLNLEVNQVSVRSARGKTNLVQLRKNLGKGKKQGTVQTLEGNPDEEEREVSSPWKESFLGRAISCAASHSLGSLLKRHTIG